jgi:putative heme transporter
VSDEQRPGSARLPVPPLLADLAGWAWRLLLLALAGYLTVRLLDTLYFVVVPFFAALFATSLAYPLVLFLRRRGLNRGLSTAITVLVSLVVAVGIAVFVVDRAVSQYSDLVDQVSQAVTHFRSFLTRDLHVKSSSTATIGNTINSYLNKHSSAVATGALSGITTVGEGLAAFVLWFFMTFFMLYDGENMWSWIVRLFPPTSRERVRGAGAQAWARLAGFVRGTFIIAVIHGVVAAIALTILGVPLVAPLALLVFAGSFLPIVGSIVFGALAAAITFVTQGWIAGVILIGILVVDNQVETHVLQPFLVGRYVRLHPLVIAVSIAGGGLLEGIYGAVLAVPFVAVVYAILRYLVTGERDEEPTDGEGDDQIADDTLVPETG